MYIKNVKLINHSGLHARPASLFVSEAKSFKSAITIRRANSDAEAKNAKSIIMLLSMALKIDEEIEIIADGEDEVQAVDSLVALVESGLGE